MDKNYDIPSRKTRGKLSSKTILLITVCFIAFVAVVAVPVSKKVEEYRAEEANIRYFYNSDNEFISATGLFCRDDINTAEKAQKALESLPDGTFDTDITSVLAQPAINNVTDDTIYTFPQIYNDVAVADGYVTVCVDSDNKVKFCSSSYVYDIPEHIERADIAQYENDFTVTNEMIYPYTRDDIPVKVNVKKDSSKLVIYKDSNSVPALGKYAVVTIEVDSQKSNYYVIFDAKTDVLVRLGADFDFEPTENVFVDNAFSSISNSPAATAIKLSIDDMWNCYLKSDWISKFNDTSLPEFVVKYDNFKSSTDNINGLMSFDYEKYQFISTSTSHMVKTNSLILSHVMYNIYLYAFEEDFNSFMTVYMTSLGFLNGDANFEDFRFAMVRAAELCEQSEKAINHINQCFELCGIKDNSYSIYKTEFDANPERKISAPAEVTGYLPKPTAKDMDEVLKVELDYYKSHFNTKKSSVFLEDLSHDGLPEMIVVNYDSWKSSHIIKAKVYTVINNKIKKIDEVQAMETRTGYNSLFVYKANGRAYLYSYNPIKWLGNGTYSHSIYYFDEKGKKLTYNSGSIEFGENMESGADKDKINKYIKKNQSYLDDSYLCVNTYPKSDFYNLDIADNNTDAIKNETSCDGYAKNSYKDEFEEWSYTLKID